MFEIFNSPELPGLIANILACVGSTMIINGLIFGRGWSRLDQPALLDNTVLPAFTPPGYAFGIIWTGLFSLMAPEPKRSSCARLRATSTVSRAACPLLFSPATLFHRD
jgi:hypothetical protein